MSESESEAKLAELQQLAAALVAGCGVYISMDAGRPEVIQQSATPNEALGFATQLITATAASLSRSMRAAREE